MACFCLSLDIALLSVLFSSSPFAYIAVIDNPVPHIIHRTDQGEQKFLLTNDYCWMVGRSEDNDLVLGDRWISRNHAMLQQMDGEDVLGSYYVIDLGSRNGTFINGRRVSIPAPLSHGDRLTFGQTEVEFYHPAHQRKGSLPMRGQQDHTATATLHVRRLISVLVLDIRDFTVLTQKIDESVLSELVGSWFRQAGQIIQQHGSWVDKYIGDAVMAVWIHEGFQEIGEDEVLKIFKALAALYEMTEELQKRFTLPFPLRVGAGINSGYAMVGNAGSGERPDYTALGDTVNAAFRLESSTKKIQTDVALGRDTYNYMTKHLPEGRTLFKENKVHLKGYENLVLAYTCEFADLERLLKTS